MNTKVNEVFQMTSDHAVELLYFTNLPTSSRKEVARRIGTSYMRMTGMIELPDMLLHVEVQDGRSEQRFNHPIPATLPLPDVPASSAKSTAELRIC